MRNLSYLSPKTEVKESPIQGKGLFAKENISKDEIVCIKGGYIFGLDEYEKFESKLGPSEIQIDDDFFIGPVTKEQRDGSMIFSNHSCDPNIGIQGQIIFVAMRNIKAGEELTHDWATTDNLDEKMECSCGSPNCRKIISGKDWTKKDLQEKYRGYFSWYIQGKIDKTNELKFDKEF